MAEEHELATLISFCGVVGYFSPWVAPHIPFGGGGSNGSSTLIVVANVLVVIAVVSC